MKHRAQFFGETELPWPKDILNPEDELLDGDDIYVRSLTPLSQFDTRATLTDVVTDGYTLFNASVFMCVGLTFDPVAASWAENKLPNSEAPLYIDLQSPLLKGLCAPYHKVLFACPNPFVSKLFRDLDRIGLRAGGTTYNSVRQKITVLDPLLARKRSGTVPTVTAHLYGLESSEELLIWKQPTSPLTQPAKLIQKAKPPKTITSPS